MATAQVNGVDGKVNPNAWRQLEQRLPQPANHSSNVRGIATLLEAKPRAPTELELDLLRRSVAQTNRQLSYRLALTTVEPLVLYKWYFNAASVTRVWRRRQRAQWRPPSPRLRPSTKIQRLARHLDIAREHHAVSTAITGRPDTVLPSQLEKKTENPRPDTPAGALPDFVYQTPPLYLGCWLFT